MRPPTVVETIFGTLVALFGIAYGLYRAGVITLESDKVSRPRETEAEDAPDDQGPPPPNGYDPGEGAGDFRTEAVSHIMERWNGPYLIYTPSAVAVVGVLDTDTGDVYLKEADSGSDLQTVTRAELMDNAPGYLETICSKWVDRLVHMKAANTPNESVTGEDDSGGPPVG